MKIKEQKIEQKRGKSNGFFQKSFTVKSNISDDGIIEVKFASFGNKDSDDDILIRGCFSKSINERGPESTTNRKIAFLWQHDMADPIGRILSMWETEDGAYAKIQLSDPDSVPNAKRTLAQLKDGTLNQFSFGFNYIWDKLDYDEAQDAYIVKEVVLFEISVVTLGANERTEFMGFAGKDLKSELMELREKDKLKYEEIKNIIKELEEAEPGTPLTSSMFEKFNK